VRKDDARLDVRLLNFDWHANVKSLGEEKAVEGLWEKIRPTVTQASICVGRFAVLPGVKGVQVRPLLVERVRGA
jgi:hypothetical protein